MRGVCSHMFEQTFVNGPQTKKPATVALSLLMQVAAVSILASLPLVYTQTLPIAQLRNLLVAPAPPQSPVAHQVVRTQARPAFHAFVVPQLIAPTRVPTGIHDIREGPAAPEFGPATSAQSASGPILDGLIASVGQALPPPQPLPKSKPSGPLRVGGNVAAANLIRTVQPVYPPLAKSARVQGSVEFTATISKDGNIENLMLVRGHPLLVNAAREAVLQWKYRPTLLNGQPVEVITDITVNFTLSQ